VKFILSAANERLQFRARICKRFRSLGIDSARLGIDSWALQKVYKFGLGSILYSSSANIRFCVACLSYANVAGRIAQLFSNFLNSIDRKTMLVQH
jgi:hypothetical protein